PIYIPITPPVLRILTQQSPLPKTQHTSATSVPPEPTSNKPKPTSGQQYSKRERRETPGPASAQPSKPPGRPPTSASAPTNVASLAVFVRQKSGSSSVFLRSYLPHYLPSGMLLD